MGEQTNNTPRQTKQKLQHDPSMMAWGWQIGLGTLLTIMGFAALSAPVLMSASAAALIGWWYHLN